MPTTSYPLEENYDYYFSNYGGPSYNDEQYYHSTNQYIQKLIDSNNKMYKFPLSEASYSINGVRATVFSTGIHRSVLLSVPKNCDTQTRVLFERAKAKADTFNGEEYTLLNHNCVQCTASVLRELAPNDSNLPPVTVSMPWVLDAHLNKYCGAYKDDTISAFTKAYQDKINQEWFSFARNREFAGGKRSINSVSEVIQHAAGDSPKKSGERTKSVLKNMGWVIEEPNGILRPGKNAPADFKEGLIAYYKKHDEALLNPVDSVQNTIHYKSRLQRFVTAVKGLVSTDDNDKRTESKDMNHPHM